MAKRSQAERAAIGGKARAQKLSPERRREIAMKGARASIAKARGEYTPSPRRPDAIAALAEKNAAGNAEDAAARAAILLDPVDWMSHYLRNPETRQPFEMYSEQIAFLREGFTPDPETMRLKYDEVIFSAPKKSGKSALASMVLLYVICALGGERAEGYIVSNSREQASDRIFNDCTAILKCSRELVANPRNDVIEFPQLDAFIKTVTTEAKSAAGPRPTIVVGDEIWGFTCLDEKTEILTKDGWAGIQDVSRWSDVATLSPEGFLEWQKPSRINVFDYSGPMHLFRHKRADFCVTPNHRVYAKFSRNCRDSFRFENHEWEFRTADQAAGIHHGWLKADAKWDGREFKTVTIPEYRTTQTYWPPMELPADPFFRVLGWFLSEGWVQFTKWGGKKYPSAVCVAQSISANPQNFAEIGDDIRQLGLGDPSQHGGQSWTLCHAQLASYLSRLGKCDEKHIPAELKNASARQLELMFRCYLRGDGWVTFKDQWQCTTVSKKLADDLMEVALKCGWMPRMMSSKKREQHHLLAYRLSFSRGPIRWEKHGKHWSIVKYEGKVWCPTVPNGTIYIRRNGKCCWTGNSEAAVRLWDEMAPTPTVPVSVRLITTYAGFVGESNLLEGYYRRIFAEDGSLQEGVKQVGTDLYAKGRTLVYWTHAWRAPWQTPEWIDTMRQAYSNRPNQFARIMENRWVSSESSFIEAEQLSRCIDIHYKPPKNAPHLAVWAAVDASVKKDSTAIVTVALDSEEVSEKKTLLDQIRSSKYPHPNALIECLAQLPWKEDFDDTTPPMTLKDLRLKIIDHKIIMPRAGAAINFVEVEHYIIGLSRRYHLQLCAYDPFQMVAVAQGLTRFGIPMYEMSQTHSTISGFTELLADLVSQERLRTYPADDLKQHILNCVAKESDRGRHIVKKARSQKIDAAVALAMACYGCAMSFSVSEETEEASSDADIYAV